MVKWKLFTEYTFDSAHFIRDYDDPCARMHGHTYKVRVESTSRRLHSSEYCPHPVMVADFRTLRWAKQDVTKGGLDRCILNEVLPEGYEATAEMTIAKYIYDVTKSKQLPDGVSLKVSVSETANSWVEYEDD